MTRLRLSLPVLIVAVLAIVAVIAATSGGAKKTAQKSVAAGSVISLAPTPAGKALVAASGQVTYNGHPLYYYVGDHGAGQTAGQA